MDKLKSIVDQMGRARAGLLLAAESISSDQWRTAPAANAWSAAEVIAHLTMVESAITAGAERMVQQPPRSVPVWKRLHVPVRMVKWRVIRRKTPIPLAPAFLSDKEFMLARVGEVREKTLIFLNQRRERDWGAYRWSHPFLGSLNVYDWLRFLAHHEARHTKQIREIIDALQN